MTRRFLTYLLLFTLLVAPYAGTAQDVPEPPEAPQIELPHEEPPSSTKKKDADTPAPDDATAPSKEPPITSPTPDPKTPDIPSMGTSPSIPAQDDPTSKPTDAPSAPLPLTQPPSTPQEQSTPSVEASPAQESPQPPMIPAVAPLQRDDVMLQRQPEAPAPTPLDNAATSPQQSPLAGKVLITEIMLGTSNDTKEEYVELFNSSDTPVSLKGIALKKMTKGGTESNLAAAKSLDTYSIAPHTFFVIANASYVDLLHADAPFSGKSFTIAENSTITLYDAAGKMIDRVGFGTATVYDKSAAPNPVKNESIERKKNDTSYVDTDDNADDFITNPCPQPGTFVPDNATIPLVISEIYPKPCTARDGDCMYTQEFIELHNPTDTPVSLARWRIRDTSKTGSHTFTKDDVIPARGYRAFSKDVYGFALNDTGEERISLISPLCQTVDTIAYTGARARLSYNAGTPWYWTEPTPDSANVPDPATLSYPPLRITEVLPRPSTDERTNEYIEIHNPTDAPVDLKNWQLRDASKTGSYTFPVSTLIPPHTFLAIYRSTFSFALNNTADTVSLITPGGVATSTVHYATTSRKDVSYNFDDATGVWRWSRHLTPNTSNIFNNLPVVVKKSFPSKGYKNVFTAFSLTAKDVDGEPLKVRWDFGDGRRSYLWKTRHKYLKNGTYNGSVRIQDGSEDITIPFTITITSFPRYKVTITELLPNPDGRDTGTEYVTLTNHSKKTIDLFGWSVATGTVKKKMVNHIIREHLTLKKGATLRITREHAAITLPNTTGTVALRAPDGTTIDSVSYAAPGKTVPEDALYVKDTTTWQWRIVPNAKKRAAAYAVAAAAAARENERVTRDASRSALYDLIHHPTSQQQPVAKTPLWLQRTMRIASTVNAVLQKLVFAVTQPRTKIAVSTFPLYTITPAPSVCAPHTYITPPHTTYTLCTYH